MVVAAVAVVVVVAAAVAVVVVVVVGIKAVDDAHTRMLLILSSSLDLHRCAPAWRSGRGVREVGRVRNYVKVARSELELCGTSDAPGAPSTKIHANPRLPSTTQHDTAQYTSETPTCMRVGLVIGEYLLWLPTPCSPSP